MDEPVYNDKATDKVETLAELPEGCIPVRVMEVCQYLNPEGKEGIAVRWQGTPNIVTELGMLEYAKLVIIEERTTPVYPVPGD